MRPCPSPARRPAGSVLGPALLGAPVLALLLGPAALPAQAAEVPACAAPDARDFPLAARLRGGPESYEAGGGYGVWYLDLVNTTARDCTGVHPVVVLVDGRRELKAGQARLEFYDGPLPRAVPFEKTDADELVGPFGEDAGAATGDAASGAGSGDADIPHTPNTPDTRFPGFTVPAHRTLTVKLRLSLTSDAVANDITARAAVVQKRGDDGEWVGQSDAYRFTVRAAPGSTAPTSPHESGSPVAGAHELAGTGLRPAVAGVAAVAGCLVAAGAALIVVRRKYYR
ncbi:hypothetical protein ABZX85_26155 [Streptomyces sp. NPDC004539]|uniref:hypothetical protein n=1 Tax=Streptomyces sp. NPDC004539 TaxID=3154280 RepID=UPI0033A3DFBD